jgi:hypothetical protein
MAFFEISNGYAGGVSLHAIELWKVSSSGTVSFDITTNLGVYYVLR